LIALEDGPKRLHEDHENARHLAEGLTGIPGIAIDIDRVVTNIVIFNISGTGKTSAEIVESLASEGVLCVGFGDQIRMVTHLDVLANDIKTTVSMMIRILS
jgi:threonine aldolase